MVSTIKLNRYFTNPGKSCVAFEAMTRADWNLAIELEAILVGFSDLALGSVQADAVSASYASLLRDECLARLDESKFPLLSGTTRFEPENSEATCSKTDLVPGAVPPRELRPTATFSSLATTCWRQLEATNRAPAARAFDR